MKNLKKNIGIVIAFLSALLFASCAKDASLAGSKPGTLSFAYEQFKLKSGEELVPTALIVTIKDANGKALYQNKRITLYDVAGTYTGESLELTEGKYYLDDFMVLGADNKVIYLTPKAGSAKANLVKTPLPIWFTIEAGVTTSVVPEVVRPEGSASDYGYVQFTYTVVNESTQKDSLCFAIGTLCKIAFSNAKIVIEWEGGSKSIAYSGGIEDVTLPVVKSEYKVSFYFGNDTPSVYTLKPTEIIQYSCKTAAHFEIWENTPVTEICFETIYYKYSTKLGDLSSESSKDFAVSLDKNGIISHSGIQTIAPIVVEKADLLAFNTILQKANVYEIHHSDILCDLAWYALDHYFIMGVNSKNDFIAQYTGSCGMNTQAQMVHDAMQTLIKKYFPTTK